MAELEEEEVKNPFEMVTRTFDTVAFSYEERHSRWYWWCSDHVLGLMGIYMIVWIIIFLLCK